MTEIEEPVEAEHVLLARVIPEAADLSAASMEKFLKLVTRDDLVVRVEATRVMVPAELYAAASKATGAAAGDVKKAEYVMDCVFITATNGEDFGVMCTWEDGVFKGAMIGGKRSGHRPERLFKQSTKAWAEVARCLS